MSKIMEYKGFKAKVMEAPKLTGDHVHQLPPGTPLEVYPVESFKNPPEDWVKTGAFVIPVRPNFGLWFDWRDNSAINTAIVPTIKGASPITGMQTSGFHLERYEDKCPKHNKQFIGDRFCEDCGYKWAPQNYITSPNTLWWDGWFNQKDGTVRQFFFSEDELRDVATHLVGKENTVPAFGFAFYSPKERRPEPQVTYRGGFNNTIIYPTGMDHVYGNVVYDSFIPEGKLNKMGGTYNSLLNMKVDGPDAPLNIYCCNSSSVVLGASTPTASGPIASGMNMTDSEDYGTIGGSSMNEIEVKAGGGSISGMRSRKKGTTKSYGKLVEDSSKGMGEDRGIVRAIKEVSIGAGAKISQALNQDSYSLDSWKDTPDSVMTIYFVFQEKYEEIARGGLRDLKGHPEGFLADVPVG